jgi:hypothetical protein
MNSSQAAALQISSHGVENTSEVKEQGGARELTSYAKRLLPHPSPFPRVEPTGIHVIFDQDLTTRIERIKNITPPDLCFGERVNRELSRLSTYYEVVGLWANYEHRSALLAEKLGISPESYGKIMDQADMNSLRGFEILCDIAQARGVPFEEVVTVVNQAHRIQPKPTARARMLMMHSIMNSTPVIVADLLGNVATGSYGFGDGTNSQIFQGKATVGDLSVSATASPRLYKEKGVKDSGLVFRFCVGKMNLQGFEEDHPLYMIDNKVVADIREWHEYQFPNAPIEMNPLLERMAKLLLVPTHDWGHSWLLYDVHAQTKSFKDWGNDIYDVTHANDNKLLINYEIVTASMHNYTWRVLFDSDPTLKEEIMSTLRAYHQDAKSLASYVRSKYGEERGEQVENYLMYIPLSTLPCVINWRSDEMQQLYNQYPLVHSQVSRILGDFFDKLSSDNDGVPAKSRDGKTVTTAEYIRRYPLQEEIEARLREERLSQLELERGAPRAEFFHAFRKLPGYVADQFTTSIIDPSVLPTLVSAIEHLRGDLSQIPGLLVADEQFIRRLKVAPSNHLFFSLRREELDYDSLTVCEQDKRVLLVEVPKGVSIKLSPRVRTTLITTVSKQETEATEDDMIAFNVQSAHHANQILVAGEGLEGKARILAMIAKGNELSLISSVEGAQDIYPLRREVAENVYGKAETGYHEVLSRKRLVCATGGPVELDLSDRSTQKTLRGVFTYIPQRDSRNSFNSDPDPDMHGIEAQVFDRTYKASSSALAPFQLRNDSNLTFGADAAKVSRAIHTFIRTLEEINLQLDHGNADGALGRTLFGDQ